MSRSVPVARAPSRPTLLLESGRRSATIAASDQVREAGRVADTGYTLAGVIRAGDGTPLSFAVYALGDVSDNAKQAIDTITTGFFRCGDNLSNH